MRFGISTACFYPDTTLTSLAQVIETGVPVTEIFLNTFHEYEDDYIAQLAGMAASSGIRVKSFHPFSSMIEGFLFASDYQGRFDDGLKLYRRFFKAAAALGAEIMVFHGDHAYNVVNCPAKEYARRFCAVAQVGREYGVTLCHENVSYCRLAQPEAVKELRPLLGDMAAFVLDTKQAKRHGVPVEEMLDAMGSDLRHVHISDYNANHNCIPPGRGDMDYRDFFDRLQQVGYTGDVVLELYRDGFDTAQDLVEGVRYLNTLIPPSGVDTDDK